MLSRTKVLMGTFVTLSLEEKNKQYFQPAFKILENIESSLSSYDTNTTIYRLNQKKSVLLDAYTYEALTLSSKYYKNTDGYFNIAIGAITKDMYHFGEEEEKVAKREDLQRSSIDFTTLFFDKNRAILGEDVKIDLGGMGKGYGVDKVIEFFNIHHVKEARVALSGDIRCIGSCTMHIKNPFRKKSLATFSMKNMGISTSGNYRRFVKSETHNHLINPKTKSSQQNFISISLISKLPNATLDAYTTAVSVMPKQKAFEFLNSLAIGYIILDSEKKLWISENLEQYVDNLQF